MHPTTRLEFDEALRQKEHSPGLDQDELIRRCSAHAHGDEEYLNSQSPMGLVLWQLYLGGMAAAKNFGELMFAGVDFTEGYEEEEAS